MFEKRGDVMKHFANKISIRKVIIRITLLVTITFVLKFIILPGLLINSIYYYNDKFINNIVQVERYLKFEVPAEAHNVNFEAFFWLDAIVNLQFDLDYQHSDLIEEPLKSICFDIEMRQLLADKEDIQIECWTSGNSYRSLSIDFHDSYMTVKIST